MMICFLLFTDTTLDSKRKENMGWLLILLIGANITQVIAVTARQTYFDL